MIDDMKLASCLLGSCTCKCHLIKIPCDICLYGTDQPRLKRRDSFKTNKTDNLNFEKKKHFTIKPNSKSLKPEPKSGSLNGGHFEDDQKFADTGSLKTTQNFEATGNSYKANHPTDVFRKSNSKVTAEDKLLRMIEKHKMERTRQPFGIDDKLFEFTQNNDFERGHRNLMSYMTARPEIWRESQEEMFK